MCCVVEVEVPPIWWAEEDDDNTPVCLCVPMPGDLYPVKTDTSSFLLRKKKKKEKRKEIEGRMCRNIKNK